MPLHLQPCLSPAAVSLLPVVVGADPSLCSSGGLGPTGGMPSLQPHSSSSAANWPIRQFDTGYPGRWGYSSVSEVSPGQDWNHHHPSFIPPLLSMDLSPAPTALTTAYHECPSHHLQYVFSICHCPISHPPSHHHTCVSISSLYYV